VRDAYSRRGVFDDGSGSDDDDVERCLRAVGELEDRVERLGADSDANDLLRAVAELRVVRGRYNDSLERRARRARLRPAASPRPASRSPPRGRDAWPAADGAAARRSYEPAAPAFRGDPMRRSTGTVDRACFGGGYEPASPRTRAARAAPDKFRHTTPSPFANLEADVQQRLHKKRVDDEAAALAAEAHAAAEERAKRALLEENKTRKPRGFAGVDAHQAAQDRRADAARSKKLAAERAEREGSTFRAKALPKAATGPSWNETLAESEMARAARVQRESEKSYARTAPARTAAKSSPRRAPTAPAEETPRKRAPEPGEVTKHLDRAHDRWRRALERSKRGGRAGTVPRDPLEARRAAAAARSAARRERRDAEAAEAEAKERRDADRARRAATRGAAKAHALETTRQTYSSYLKAQAVRERQRAAREAEARDEAEAQARADRLRAATKRLAEDMKRDLDAPREPKEDPADVARRAQKDFKRKLKENKRRLKDAAAKAPSLMTRLKIDSAKDKARVEALKRVSQAVYGTTKADWSAVIADSDIFDADDKRFLDIDDYDDGDEFD